MAGYSGTPLFKKLGIKPGFRVKVRHHPANYLELLEGMPAEVNVSSGLRGEVDLWHLFTRSASELKSVLPAAIKQIKRDGMIWVSWPKKSSGVTTDLTEDTVRAAALPLGLVDVKVCAVDETWSGLKLVIRKGLR